MTKAYTPEVVSVATLRAHPRNYNAHPQDQLEHLKESIREHGVYRNVVVARDYTVLAGHGVVEAARASGMTELPVVRLDLDPNEPRALKVLTGDNEVAHLGDKDDRLLSELLREIKDHDPNGLLGTGYDEMMLANLVLITRPESEIGDFDEAAEWVGMPEYARGEDADPMRLIVSFANLEDRNEFAAMLGIELSEKQKSIWWPPREKDDVASLRFEG